MTLFCRLTSAGHSALQALCRPEGSPVFPERHRAGELSQGAKRGGQTGQARQVGHTTVPAERRPARCSHRSAAPPAPPHPTPPFPIRSTSFPEFHPFQFTHVHISSTMFPASALQILSSSPFSCLSPTPPPAPPSSAQAPRPPVPPRVPFSCRILLMHIRSMISTIQSQQHSHQHHHLSLAQLSSLFISWVHERGFKL